MGTDASLFQVVRLRATIPSDADAEPKVVLTDVPPSLADAKSKYLPATPTAATPCGIPCVLYSQIESHYNRLSEQPAPTPSSTESAPVASAPTAAPPVAAAISAQQRNVVKLPTTQLCQKP